MLKTARTVRPPIRTKGAGTKELERRGRRGREGHITRTPLRHEVKGIRFTIHIGCTGTARGQFPVQRNFLCRLAQKTQEERSNRALSGTHNTLFLLILQRQEPTNREGPQQVDKEKEKLPEQLLGLKRRSILDHPGR